MIRKSDRGNRSTKRSSPSPFRIVSSNDRTIIIKLKNIELQIFQHALIQFHTLIGEILMISLSFSLLKRKRKSRYFWNRKNIMLRFKRATILARSVYTQIQVSFKNWRKKKRDWTEAVPKKRSWLSPGLEGGKAAGRKTTVSHLAVEIASCTLARTWCTVVWYPYNAKPAKYKLGWRSQHQTFPFACARILTHTRARRTYGAHEHTDARARIRLRTAAEIRHGTRC